MWLSGVAQAAFVLGVCGPVGFAALAWNVRAGAPDGLVDTRCPAAQATRGLGQAMALPVLCAVALTLITPIATSLFGAGGDPVWGRVVKPVSHAVCLVILAAVWFGARRDLSLPRFYSVSLPLFASIILLAVAVGGPASWLVLIVGNGCYFFVSLLMVTTCLELSARFGARVVSLYGVFAGCMYLSDVAQLAVNYLMSAGVLVGAEAYVTGALLLYVVMIPVFFMVTRRKASPAVAAENGVPDENGVLAEKPADDGLPAQERPARASVEEACAQIAREVGLTPRQIEVMAGLVAGRDVVHIAESLGLAQNTVRSYRKALYAALNVHGRQELLDLVDAAREG
jgi:DNA-binding CsgD family transcriptional regulator